MREHKNGSLGQSTISPIRQYGQIGWRLLRPFTLTASIIPVLIGTTLAMHMTSINFSMFVAMLIACIVIQTATNVFNEYYDYKRGLDTAESVGIGGAIVRDGVPPKIVLWIAIFLFALAVMIGFYISLNSSWWVAIIGSLSMAAGYFYTGGPYPIAYTPFGELVAGFFMGIVIVLLTFFIQTGTVTIEGVIASIPISILVGAILMANNIRDLDEDVLSGRRTLAILLGRRLAIQFLAVMFLSVYVALLGFMFFGGFSFWLLLAFLSLPKAVQAIRLFRGKKRPQDMMPAMKATAIVHTQFGILMSLSLFLASW